jgi:inner membrane protein
MDPLSQGVFGTLFASAAAPRRHTRQAALLGALSGMAADLDIFIRSSEDPLLALQFHRHFTHSIAFIPVGALLCALALKPFFKSLSFSRVYLYAFLGYASHGLLDSFTSYGTQMFWPFSNFRVAWDSIAIIDPLFTVPVMLALVAWAIKSSKFWRAFAWAWATIYLSLGFVQRNRALDEVAKLAASRGHVPLRMSAKPSLGNLWLFRGLYETETRHYADAIRVPFLGDNKIYEGGSLEKFDATKLGVAKDSRLMRDIERFAWFSDRALALSPSSDPQAATIVVGDFRYSMLPTGISPLWGIVVDKSRPDDHVKFENFRSVTASDRAELWRMLMGR